LQKQANSLHIALLRGLRGWDALTRLVSYKCCVCNEDTLRYVYAELDEKQQNTILNKKTENVPGLRP